MSVSGREQWFQFWRDNLTDETLVAIQAQVVETKRELPLSITRVEQHIAQITHDLNDQKALIESQSTPEEQKLSDDELRQAIEDKQDVLSPEIEEEDDDLEEVVIDPKIEEEIRHINIILAERNKYKAIENALAQKNREHKHLENTLANVEEVVLRDIVTTLVVPADFKQNREPATQADLKSPTLTDQQKKYNARKSWSQILSARGSHQTVKGFTPGGEPTAYWERITGKGISTLNIEHKILFGKTLFEKYEQRGQLAEKFHLNPVPFDKWLESYVSTLSENDPRQKQFLNAYRNMVFLKTEEERIPYKAKLENGNIYLRVNHPDKPYHSDTKPDENGWALADSTELKQSDYRGQGILIFAYNVDTKELYIAQPMPGIMHHSSFLDSSNHNVIAGTFTIENGKITKIGNDSGHYRNSAADFMELCATLQEQNVLNLNHVKLLKKEMVKSPTSPASISDFTNEDFNAIRVGRVEQEIEEPYEIAAFLESAKLVKNTMESDRLIKKIKEEKRIGIAKGLLREKVKNIREKKGSLDSTTELNNSTSTSSTLSPTFSDSPPPLEAASLIDNDELPTPLTSPLTSFSDLLSPIPIIPQGSLSRTFFLEAPPSVNMIETLLQDIKASLTDEKQLPRKEKEIQFLQSILDLNAKEPSSLKKLVKSIISTNPSSYNTIAKNGLGNPTALDKLMRKILKEDYNATVDAHRSPGQNKTP